MIAKQNLQRNRVLCKKKPFTADLPALKIFHFPSRFPITLNYVSLPSFLPLIYSPSLQSCTRIHALAHTHEHKCAEIHVPISMHSYAYAHAQGTHACMRRLSVHTYAHTCSPIAGPKNSRYMRVCACVCACVCMCECACVCL